MKSNVDNPGSVTVNVSAITTQTDVTASRAIDGTVYHNTTGKPIYCMITLQLSTPGVGVTLLTDANPAPSTVVAFEQNNNAQLILVVLMAIVLPGNYYTLTSLGNSFTQWIEYS
jgi:hypothetical protein